MTAEGTACPSSTDASSCPSRSWPQLGSAPRAAGQAGASRPTPGAAQRRRREDGMEAWLPAAVLPLLLLAWLPAGESPRPLRCALRLGVCPQGVRLLLLLFPLPLQRSAPLSAPAPCALQSGSPCRQSPAPGLRALPAGTQAQALGQRTGIAFSSGERRRPRGGGRKQRCL